MMNWKQWLMRVSVVNATYSSHAILSHLFQKIRLTLSFLTLFLAGINKSVILPYNEYCYHIWFGISVMYLESFGKKQNKNIVCKVSGREPESQSHSLFHCLNLDNPWRFCQYFHSNYSNEIFCLVPNVYEFNCCTWLVGIIMIIF